MGIYLSLSPLSGFVELVGRSSTDKKMKIYDVDGKEYLDFVCMFGAVNQGHIHPRIVEAVVEQVRSVGEELSRV